MSAKEISGAGRPEESSMLAYCGLYCGACSFKTAFETSNRKHLLDMPDEYGKHKAAPLENCAGCKPNCGDCGIRACAKAKGHGPAGNAPIFPAPSS